MEMDGYQERVLGPCLGEGAREKRVTAVKADPAGKIEIQAVERSGSGMGRVRAPSSFGSATVNQTPRELALRRQIR